MKYSSSVTMALVLQAATAGLHSAINEVPEGTKGPRSRCEIVVLSPRASWPEVMTRKKKKIVLAV